MAEPPLLEIEKLSTGYGEARILFDLDLSVASGEAVALLGRNGAGKSTTMKAVMGILAPRGGRMRFAGTDIGGLPPFRIARLGIGYVPEERRVFHDLTVEENLEVGRRAGRSGAAPWTAARVMEVFPALEPLRRRHAGRLSGGEQQMLTIARTLMGNPRLLLLDEPSEGLAPVVLAPLAAAIARLQAEGMAVLVSEQNLAFAGKVAARAYVLERGAVRLVAPMAELMTDSRQRRELLGV